MSEPNDASSYTFAVKLKQALAVANVPTLQMLCLQLSGDMSWIERPFLPTRCKGIDDNDSGGLASELQDQIRAGAFEAIMDWRAGKPIAIPVPSQELLLRMMTVSVGEVIPADYADLMAAKMDMYNNPTIEPLKVAVPDGFRVLIIGAGMSGICAAIRLKQAGVPFAIYEKGEDVGGVWLQNRYPGCGVDTPSHLYSYSFAQGDWQQYFGSKREVFGYFRRVAQEGGVYDGIQFRAEVVSTSYDESTCLWTSEVHREDGTVEEIGSNIVIAAVGAFGSPKWPDIRGFDDFRGTLVHTAVWDAGLDLTDQRVGVIGNGASAMQVVPAIADQVATLTIFQRSKQWIAPFAKFRRPIPDPLRFLFSEVPLYEWWYRLRLSWIFDSKVFDSLHVDPEWEHPERSLNAINEGHRRFFTRYITSELGDRQDLAPRVIPEYPPYGKRMLLDNGWYRTLTKPHVELIEEPIERINETGIQVDGGPAYEFDAIIVASGFDVARFVSSTQVLGVGGKSIRDVWDDDNPMAYLGTVVPGFPNFFMLFGPNTSLGHGGSLIFVIECQVNYVLSVIEQMLTSGSAAIDCKSEVCAGYNNRMDERHSRMIWTHPGMQTYYRNSRGRVVFNSPWRTVDYWRFTRRVNPEDFNTSPGSPATQQSQQTRPRRPLTQPRSASDRR